MVDPDAKDEDIIKGTISERTQVYTTSKNLLMNSADAWERLMTSYKEVWWTHPLTNPLISMMYEHVDYVCLLFPTDN